MDSARRASNTQPRIAASTYQSRAEKFSAVGLEPGTVIGNRIPGSVLAVYQDSSLQSQVTDISCPYQSKQDKRYNG